MKQEGSGGVVKKQWRIRLFDVLVLFFCLVFFAFIMHGQMIVLKKNKAASDKAVGYMMKPGKVKIFDYKTGKVNEVDKIVKSEKEYTAQLNADVCYIVRKGGTEAAFTGKYVNNHKNGIYKCVVCGTDLFVSDTKFESGTGWPSFFQPVSKLNIMEVADTNAGMTRTEVKCARCGSHLGHVFNDGPKPTGLRYCMNSKALVFEESK